ncbi:MAG TPA: aconitase family protein [Polyangiaceae bacterium]|nr:aconitase family protein [Polyangiaceae bacterium]
MTDRGAGKELGTPTEAPDGLVTFRGRVLFLAEDADLLRAQLAGVDLGFDPARRLLDNISTDEITPSWVCYYYDETLGRYCLVGLRGGHVTPGAVRSGGFEVIVSGISKGCGSSRETAPYSELSAGVKLVIAASFEKIYRQNAQNIGLHTSTDFGLVPRILGGESIPMFEFTRGLDPISAAVVEHGGLFAYNRARLAGRVSPPAVSTAPRPMTVCEKILARHAIVDAHTGRVGVVAVRPGDAFFARADVRFSHEYVTPMADALFRSGFGDAASVADPATVYAFRDHLTLLDRVMPRSHKAMGLDAQARRLAEVQAEFVHRSGIALYGDVQRGGIPAGSEAICHNKVIDDIALPGQLVIGTDSHTCMAGALGCLAFGVGATDMANAWATRDVRVTVPGTVRIVLRGRPRPSVCAKDVMLWILAQPFFKLGRGIGKVLEFAGDGVQSLALDERATLTNMSVEAGGFTGIVEADDRVVVLLADRRGLRTAELEPLVVRADPDAQYDAAFDVDLSTVACMVATPGDPRNGIPLDALDRRIAIDIAYGGSCTGGKRGDMDMYAQVLADALAKGKRVASGVELFLQFGSQDIRRYAERRGYLDLFSRAGATLVDPSCGACIKAGPGASERPEQVTVSAQNRNFPGRSGPGQVYLASPYVVAASAILGRIGSPEEI